MIGVVYEDLSPHEQALLESVGQRSKRRGGMAAAWSVALAFVVGLIAISI